jgi:hypothetical protein
LQVGLKTQIIQLNQNDDTLSVRDKMNWSQTGRILLVWPLHGHVLNRQLDLNLVKRHAATMGAQLALVTHDSEVRFYAQQIGIPVFNNSRDAQDHHWRVSRYRNINIQGKSNPPDLDNLRKNIPQATHPWLEHPAIRFLCLGFSVLALFTLGIFILPSAKIMLSPQVETQSMKFDIYMNPSSTSINLSTGSLPTYSQEVIVEGRDTITATGSMIIPDEPSLGSLKFTNISNQIINIPSGTIVSTIGSNPARFITTSKDDVTVNPNKSINLSARAIKPGSSGNLSSNQLVAIEGELGLDMTVTNPHATYGGTDAAVPSSTEKDFQLLRNRLTIKLKQTALAEMETILDDEDTLISPTLTIVETLGESSIPAIGEPGDQLELSLRLRLQSQVVSGEALRSLVISILNYNIPTGYSPLMNTLDITSLSNPSLGKDGISRWSIRAARKLQADVPADFSVEMIKGVTVARAMERLSASLPLEEQAKIKIAPNWWPWLPFLTMRIELIKEDIQ